MMNKKSQEMSIQTVVVLILIMIVLVVVISFSIPQLTNMFGGLSGVGSDIDESIEGMYDCRPILTGCHVNCSEYRNTERTNCNSTAPSCCRWSSI